MERSTVQSGLAAPFFLPNFRTAVDRLARRAGTLRERPASKPLAYARRLPIFCRSTVAPLRRFDWRATIADSQNWFASTKTKNLRQGIAGGFGGLASSGFE